MEAAPFVFVSHASEDKATFAKPIADLLLANGCEAWLDIYQLSAGQDLPQELEDAIAKSTDIIVILSPNYLEKRWSRAEYSAAIHRKIEKGIRLIPIMAHKCEVPTLLASTFRLNAKDFPSTNGLAQKVLDTIHNKSIKPGLGESPTYTNITFTLPELNKADTTLMEIIYEHIAREAHFSTLTEPVIQSAKENGLSEKQIVSGFEMLKEHYYLQSLCQVQDRENPIPIIAVTASTYGVLNFAEISGRANVADLELRLASAIINDNKKRQEDLQPLDWANHAVISAILEEWDRRDWISLHRSQGGGYTVTQVKVKLERWFEDNG